jgi:hypothetical protein
MKKSLLLSLTSIILLFGCASNEEEKKSTSECAIVENFKPDKTSFGTWIPDTKLWAFAAQTNKWTIKGMDVKDSTTLTSPIIQRGENGDSVPTVRFFINNYDKQMFNVYFGIPKKDGSSVRKMFGREYVVLSDKDYDYYNIQDIKNTYPDDIKKSNCFKQGFVEFQLPSYIKEATIQYRFLIKRRSILMKGFFPSANAQTPPNIEIENLETGGGGANGSCSNGRPPCIGGE